MMASAEEEDGKKNAENVQVAEHHGLMISGPTDNCQPQVDQLMQPPSHQPENVAGELNQQTFKFQSENTQVGKNATLYLDNETGARSQISSLREESSLEVDGRSDMDRVYARGHTMGSAKRLHFCYHQGPNFYQIANCCTYIELNINKELLEKLQGTGNLEVDVALPAAQTLVTFKWGSFEARKEYIQCEIKIELRRVLHETHKAMEARYLESLLLNKGSEVEKIVEYFKETYDAFITEITNGCLLFRILVHDIETMKRLYDSESLENIARFLDNLLLTSEIRQMRDGQHVSFKARRINEPCRTRPNAKNMLQFDTTTSRESKVTWTESKLTQLIEKILSREMQPFVSQLTDRITKAVIKEMQESGESVQSGEQSGETMSRPLVTESLSFGRPPSISVSSPDNLPKSTSQVLSSSIRTGLTSPSPESRSTSPGPSSSIRTGLTSPSPESRSTSPGPSSSIRTGLTSPSPQSRSTSPGPSSGTKTGLNSSSPESRSTSPGLHSTRTGLGSSRPGTRSTSPGLHSTKTGLGSSRPGTRSTSPGLPPSLEHPGTYTGTSSSQFSSQGHPIVEPFNLSPDHSRTVKETSGPGHPGSESVLRFYSHGQLPEITGATNVGQDRVPERENLFRKDITYEGKSMEARGRNPYRKSHRKPSFSSYIFSKEDWTILWEDPIKRTEIGRALKLTELQYPLEEPIAQALHCVKEMVNLRHLAKLMAKSLGRTRHLPHAHCLHTVLCIDVSESMKGESLQKLKDCAEKFRNDIEDNTVEVDLEENVGVVLFGGQGVEIKLIPTNDYNKLNETINQLDIRAGENCSLLEALIASVLLLFGTDPDEDPYFVVGDHRLYNLYPRIILMSDGLIAGKGRKECIDKKVYDAVCTYLPTLLRASSNNCRISCVLLGDEESGRILMSDLSKETESDAVDPTQIQWLSHYFRLENAIGTIVDWHAGKETYTNDELNDRITEEFENSQITDDREQEHVRNEADRIIKTSLEDTDMDTDHSCGASAFATQTDILETTYTSPVVLKPGDTVRKDPYYSEENGNQAAGYDIGIVTNFNLQENIAKVRWSNGKEDYYQSNELWKVHQNKASEIPSLQFGHDELQVDCEPRSDSTERSLTEADMGIRQQFDYPHPARAVTDSPNRIVWQRRVGEDTWETYSPHQIEEIEKSYTGHSDWCVISSPDHQIRYHLDLFNRRSTNLNDKSVCEIRRSEITYEEYAMLLGQQ
ncbi:uncharacterized protein [Argopecten irradians]|uniref:uncharacterized protein n=1 Tax=Argopecten irradians TaxID=31199 RepID=UPI0037118451